MAQVLVRNLPAETVALLKERAQRHRRSLQAELREILEEAAKPPRGDWRAALERLDLRLTGRTLSDSTELIRQDRESH